ELSKYVALFFQTLRYRGFREDSYFRHPVPSIRKTPYFPIDLADIFQVALCESAFSKSSSMIIINLILIYFIVYIIK
ncbi:hypothetical protein, partial [Methanobrevibacter sp.]